MVVAADSNEAGMTVSHCGAGDLSIYSPGQDSGSVLILTCNMIPDKSASIRLHQLLPTNQVCESEKPICSLRLFLEAVSQGHTQCLEGQTRKPQKSFLCLPMGKNTFLDFPIESMVESFVFDTNVLQCQMNEKTRSSAETLCVGHPYHLVWGTKFGQHDPLWRMENITSSQKPSNICQLTRHVKPQKGNSPRDVTQPEKDRKDQAIRSDW